jgi:hypothetical protein
MPPGGLDHRGIVKPHHHVAVTIDALADADHAALRHQLEGPFILRLAVPGLDRQALAVGAAAHQQQRVLEPLGGEQPDTRPALVDQRVGGDRAPLCTALDLPPPA